MSRQIRRLGLSKTIEIAIPNNVKKSFQFSDTVLLFDRVLVHAFHVRVSGVKTLEFRDQLPAGNIESSFLTLSSSVNQQFNLNIPLAIFDRELLVNQNTQSTYPIIFIKPKLISIRNSTLLIPNANTMIIPAGGYGLNFTFFYDIYDENKHQLNQWGELINDVDMDY